MTNTASQKQIDFINALKAQRDVTAPAPAQALSLSQDLWRQGEFTTRAASLLIDALKEAPTGAGATTIVEEAPEAPEGMHLLDGVIYKVQRAIHGSGRLYAKQLSVQDGVGTFEFAPGMVRHLSEATKMSLEDAKAYGALYGTCVVCGRTLTNEESIAAGIGPVCAGRF